MASMISAWEDSWNEIIRNVIYPDVELQELMMLPEDTSIIDFIDRYFIKADYTTKLLKDESVRIVYSEMADIPTASHKVMQKGMSFDIYVKLEHVHDIGYDRLKFRTTAIADKLYSLLTSSRYLYGYRFWINSKCDLGTRTIGYARYNLTLGYMTTY